MPAIFIIATTAFAQDKNDAMKTAADTICHCLDRIKTAELAPEKVKELAMECFTTSAMDHYVKLAEERGIDIMDQEAMRKLGIEVGKELLKMKCGSYLKVSAIMAGKDDDSQEGSKTEMLQAKLARVDNKDFTYLILKDNNNKEHSFLWFEYFAGSEKFTGGKLNNFIGKRLKVSWMEKEVYLPKANGYFKIKQITGLETVE